MSDVLDSTESGWRPDPSGRYEWRYWDGGWTNRVANSARPGDLPPAPDSAPVTPGPAGEAPAAAAAPAAQPVPPAAEAPSAAEPVVEPPTATVAPVGRGELAAPSAPPAPAVSAASGVPADPTAASDPFAALRVPRSVDESNEPMAQTPGEEPVRPERVEPEPVVRTHPTRHDGTTGTAWDAPYVPPGYGPGPTSDQHGSASDPSAAPDSLSRRRGILGAVTGFFRSFWEQEESYHSPNAGVQLPPHPKQQQLAPPPSYARAGLVMLAAAGVAIGAYLPWISGHINGNPYELTGYQLHDAWGFTWVAAAFALAAVLGARHRVMGWVTMGMSVVVAGLAAKQLLDTHDMVASLNTSLANDLNIGVGLWIMLASAAIGLIAAFRLDTPAEIV